MSKFSQGKAARTTSCRKSKKNAKSPAGSLHSQWSCDDLVETLHDLLTSLSTKGKHVCIECI